LKEEDEKEEEVGEGMVGELDLHQFVFLLLIVKE
jgi:hypothetical protein